MNTHINTLAEWWDNAEQADVIGQGDIVIEDRRNKEGGFDIWPASHRTDPDGRPDRRILHPAPKPKPAWHNAVAVLANHRDYEDEPRTVWTRESDPEGHDWSDAHTTMAAPHHLVNVTPLIEAKVTDEMVLRALNASMGLDLPHHTSYKRDEVEDMRIALHSALTLDPA